MQVNKQLCVSATARDCVSPLNSSLSTVSWMSEPLNEEDDNNDDFYQFTDAEIQTARDKLSDI